jgi:hypothetical protein
MENDMAIRRLAYILIFSAIFLQNCKEVNTFLLEFEGYKIKEERGNLIFPKIKLSLKTINNEYHFDIQDPSIKNKNFVITEDTNKLRFKIEGCEKEVELLMTDEAYFYNECESIYPFILEKMTLLDVKKIHKRSGEYEILKITNESYEDNTTLFWLKGFGLIMMKLENGIFYHLTKTDGYSKLEWKSILREMKKEVDFSEHFKTPSLPPLPPKLK